MKTTIILTAENEHLKVQLLEDGSAQILDKASGAEWSWGRTCFQEMTGVTEDVVWNRQPRCWADLWISYFRLRLLADGRMRVSVLDHLRQERGQFTLALLLQGREFTLEVSDIEERLPSLVFPPPIQSAALVIPDRVGRLIRHGNPSMEPRLVAQNNGLNMRFIGGLEADLDRGWQMIFGEEYEDSGAHVNGRAASPIWLKCKSVWRKTRSVIYAFTQGGYVGQAQHFRRYLDSIGVTRTLEEKMERNPLLRELQGGRILSFMQSWTSHAGRAEEFLGQPSPESLAMDGKLVAHLPHKDVAEAIALAKEWGMERGIFNLRGTWHGGYDENHPDIWPPEPALGSLDELRSLIRQDGPYLTVLHDNYQDMYPHTPSFPDGVVRRRDGQFLHGGYWHGGLCYIVCPTQQKRYAERNWKIIGPELKPRGWFVDTATCVQFYQCWDPDHPMTRAEDRAAKLGLIRFYKEQGLILGSEEAADFGVGEIDFLENRHQHVIGETIPLWPLVFHDVMFLARYSTQGTSGGRPARQLENFLWGYMSYWPVNAVSEWRTWKREFQESLEVDRLHRRIGSDRMTNHRVLTADGLVEQTEFSSGVSVVANFGSEPVTVEGRTIQAQGHLVLD